MTDELIPDRFKAAAFRALGIGGVAGAIEAIGSGKLRSADANEETALVEMVFIMVEDGDIQAPPFLPRPPHLPTTDAELAELLASKTGKDATLRGDVIEWRELNKLVESAHARNLRTMVEACRKAVALQDDPHVDERVIGWYAAIMAKANRVFSCDVRDAPEGHAELDAWTRETLRMMNPCPDWLAAGEKFKTMFERPRPRLVRDDPFAYTAPKERSHVKDDE